MPCVRVHDWQGRVGPFMVGTSMMRPLGKPPPRAMSSVKAPQEICSLKCIEEVSWIEWVDSTPQCMCSARLLTICTHLTTFDGSKFGRRSSSGQLKSSVVRSHKPATRVEQVTHTTLSGSAPMHIRLPLPKRAFTSFITFSSAVACNISAQRTFRFPEI